ncbi:MAG: hypothetical protein GY821_12860 [Gammaproteobacteria bacterium]|nr:hypothetical protein [Gammaproteobacteria bacterium]
MKKTEMMEKIFPGSCDGEGTIVTLLRMEKEGEDNFYVVEIVQDEFILELQYMSVKEGESQARSAFNIIVLAGQDNIVFGTIE